MMSTMLTNSKVVAAVGKVSILRTLIIVVNSSELLGQDISVFQLLQNVIDRDRDFIFNMLIFLFIYRSHRLPADIQVASIPSVPVGCGTSHMTSFSNLRYPGSCFLSTTRNDKMEIHRNFTRLLA
jgi:hypothetical protein